MIIGVCGFVSTGSSAVSDFLKEFDEVSSIDSKEFNIAYFPDGLEDLDYHLNVNCSKYMSSVAAFERFRLLMENFYISSAKNKNESESIRKAVDDFLQSIVQTTWEGYGSIDLQTIIGSRWLHTFLKNVYSNSKKMNSFFSKKAKENSNVLPAHRMEFSICPDGFIDNSRKLVEQLLQIYGADFSKKVVIDQPFAGNNPEKSFKFFNDPYAIVVDRDPRDQYLFAKKFLYARGRMIPTDDVKKFIEYYKRLRVNQPFSTDNCRILNVQFEDMIYRYEETTQKVLDFVGLHEQKRKKKIFEPSMSINNTQLYSRFKGYEQDIALIESELSEYIYPFEQFEPMKSSGKMFYGKSPLNG